MQEAKDDATRLALADQQQAGIDIVCDGEQRRPTHFSYFLAQLNNVDFVNLGERARRGGTAKTQVPRVTGPLSLKTRDTLNDYHALRKLTAHPAQAIKMTLPGPFTMAQQAKNEFYKDPDEMVMDYAAAVNAEVHDLVRAGADVVQLDEPWLRNDPAAAKRIAVKAIDRALVKFRSGFYSELVQYGGVGRANYLACLALFDDNPALINEIEPNLRKVTPALLQAVAKMAAELPVLYVTGEESLAQVAGRAHRLELPLDGVNALAETGVESILQHASRAGHCWRRSHRELRLIGTVGTYVFPAAAT